MKQLFLFFMVLISLEAYSQTKDSLPPEIEDFINNEINLEGLSVTCQKLRKMQQYKTNKVIILDARDAQSFKKNRIKGARRLGYSDSNFTVKNVWYLNRNKRIVVYSEKGVKSKEAAKKLKDMGFTKIYNLIGGLDEWNRKLLPTIGRTKK